MNDPLRVLMALDAYPPESWGGAERVVHGWSRELAARGHEVWVLSGKIGVPPGPDEERAGYRVRWWSSRRRTFWDGYVSAIRSCAKAAGALAGGRGFDIVHCHQALSGYAVLRSGVVAPLVCTFHAPWHEEFSEDAHARAQGLPVPVRSLYRAAAAIKTVRIRAMEQSCLARSNGIAVLSEFSRDRLSRAHALPRERIDILPGGVEMDRFFPKPEAERERIRSRLGFRGPTILSVRRLVWRMGLDVLIRALPSVRAEVPGTQLVFVGTGPERDRLETLAGDLGVGSAVRFAGFVSDAELPDYYRAADVFVLPSRSLEGYGVATLEALASGTPVVGTATGATPELLRPLDAGLLVEGNNPSALASAVVRWLRSPALLREIRGRCREHVERNYSWARAGEAVERFYQKVLTG